LELQLSRYFEKPVEIFKRYLGHLFFTTAILNLKKANVKMVVFFKQSISVKVNYYNLFCGWIIKIIFILFITMNFLNFIPFDQILGIGHKYSLEALF